MRCRISRQDVLNAEIARQAMNFGQPWPEGVALPYELETDALQFAHNMTDVFAKAAGEEQADGRYHEKGEWPVMDRWAELGYAGPATLLSSHPEVLEALVRESFDAEALDRLIPMPAHGIPRYLINSVDQVEVSGNLLRLRGRAYQHPQWQENRVSRRIAE